MVSEQVLPLFHTAFSSEELKCDFSPS